MIKILILGGGFGGVRAALELEKKLSHSNHQFRLTLVERNGYHLFVPALYEVASAYGIKKDPFAVQLKRTVCMPYADIFEGKNIDFIQAEVSEIDINRKFVITKGNHTLEYDYLIFALGSEVNDYGIKGVLDYANQFKTLDDSIFINQKLQEISGEFQRQERNQPFSFLVCGGGFTGIELAAELGSYSRVIENSCKLSGRCSNITIFEAGPKILPAISDRERKFIKKRLTKLGIILMENSPIEEVGNDFVKLKTGQTVHGNLIVWTAGIKSNKLLHNIAGLPITQTGKIIVEATLQAKGFSEIFSIGDDMEFIDPKTQKPVPSFAYTAGDQAKIAAINILNLINKKSLKKYNPYYNIWIIPIGGKYALAHLWGSIRITGFLGWIVRELVDLRYLLSIFNLNKALEVFFNEVTIFTRND
jgi:NADH dehydrogenase